MSRRCVALLCTLALIHVGALAADAATDKAGPAPAGGVAAPATTPAAPGKSAETKKAPATQEKKVDINNASLEELKTRLKLGEAEAKKIVENRPYKSKGELVTKAGLPEGVYQAIRHHVEMQKPRKAAQTK